MGEANNVPIGGSQRTLPGSSDFERRIITMLEGAAFALLEDQIREREEAAHATATRLLQHERDEVARLLGEAEAAKKAADAMQKEAKEYQERVRSRFRKAVNEAQVYQKALEELHERLNELRHEADAHSVSGELDAMVEVIEQAFRDDPHFQ